MKTSRPDSYRRRALLATALVGGGVLFSSAGQARGRRVQFDRAAYDRYVRLMNAEDPRFAEYYADDIKFEMGIRGKANVLDFYTHQWPYVKETLTVSFFCSDADGAASQVTSELRCIKDFGDTSVFGRALKVGEVQRVRGYVFYLLDGHGRITEINGPKPEILQPWHVEAG